MKLPNLPNVLTCQILYFLFFLWDIVDLPNSCVVVLCFVVVVVFFLKFTVIHTAFEDFCEAGLAGCHFVFIAAF